MTPITKKAGWILFLSLYIAFLNLSTAYTLPTHIDLRNYLPPVGNQGVQESSVGWAIGYYIMGFYESKVYGKNILFSPSFIYNQLSAGDLERGGRIEDALKIVHQQGCAKLSDMGYDEHDCSTLPDINQYIAAMPYRIDGYESVFQKNSKASLDDLVITNIKSILVSGDPVIVKIPVFNSFKFPTSKSWVYKDEKPFFYNPITVGSSFESVVLCICGYDDEVGGFLIRSSWGEDWAYAGDAYISYEFFKKYALEGWKVTAFSNHRVAGYVAFDVSCEHRGDFDLWVGNDSGWEKKVFGYVDVDDNRPDIRMAVDLTDGIDVNPSENRWYLRMEDRFSDQLTGQINMFRFFEDSAESDAGDLPAECPDGGSLKIYVIRDFSEGQLSLVSSVLSGKAPLFVSFSISGISDKSRVLEYQWDFDGDGSVDRISSDPVATHTYRSPGRYIPEVRVVYLDGNVENVTSQDAIDVVSGGKRMDRPAKPVINSPSKVPVSLDYTVTSSDFYSSYGGKHKLSRWLVMSSAGKIFDRTVSNESYLTSLPLSLLALDEGNYRIRVAYCDESGSWSDWSEFVSFNLVDGDVKGNFTEMHTDLNNNGVYDEIEGYTVVVNNGILVGFKVIGGDLKKYVLTTNEIGNLLVVRIVPHPDAIPKLDFIFDETTSVTFIDPFVPDVRKGISFFTDGGDGDVDGVCNGYIVAIFSLCSKGKPQLPSAGGCSINRYSQANCLDFLFILFLGIVPLLLRKLQKRNRS